MHVEERIGQTLMGKYRRDPAERDEAERGPVLESYLARSALQNRLQQTRTTFSELRSDKKK